MSVRHYRVVDWLKSRRVIGGPDGHPYGDQFGGCVPDFRVESDAVKPLAGIDDPSNNIDGDLQWHDLRQE